MLVAERRSRLGRLSRSPRNSGQVLLWAPEWDEFDGNLELQSQGFFDVNDSPPWDMWIGWITHPHDPSEWFGVSWIPDRYIELIDKARELETAEVVKWAWELVAGQPLAEPFRGLTLPTEVNQRESGF